MPPQSWKYIFVYSKCHPKPDQRRLWRYFTQPIWLGQQFCNCAGEQGLCLFLLMQLESRKWFLVSSTLPVSQISNYHSICQNACGSHTNWLLDFYKGCGGLSMVANKAACSPNRQPHQGSWWISFGDRGQDGRCRSDRGVLLDSKINDNQLEC